MNQTAAQHEALHHAFSAFANVSRDLEVSYKALETRVSDLSGQLARADRELESRLEEQGRLTRRFERLLGALPGGVIVLDAQGIVRECNPAAERLLGRSLRGESWRRVVSRAFSPRPDDGHDITLSTGYRVNLSTCSLHGEPGQILLLADVTETRKLQEHASRLERLTSIGRTVAALAHQIRTPLAGALLYASTLPSGLSRENILERLRALEGLVEDMLTYARQGEFTMEPLNLFDLLEQLIRRQVHPENAKVRVRRVMVPEDEGSAVVQGNRDALASAIQNLLDNAWQAAGDVEVCLTLEVCRDNESVELLCSDNGPGIPTAMHERIFEPFVTTRESGTGLGLAIVRAIVEAHGGGISVRSAPELGTTFRITLPMVAAAVEPYEVEASACAATHPRRAR